MARMTLEGWIQEALTDEEKGIDPETKEPAKCYRLVLMHQIGLGFEEVAHITFGAKVWTVADLAKMFNGKAAVRAQDLAGMQTFKMLAFYGTSAEPQAAFIMTVLGQQDSTGVNTEGPTAQGVTQQAMRHLENRIVQADKTEQLAVQNLLQAAEAWRGVAQMMASELLTTKKENKEVMDLFKQMTIEKVAADHQNKMTQLEFERKTGERNKLMTFLPVLANTVAGREVFPQSTADSALLDTLIDNVGAEKIGMLTTLLPAEVMGPLAARAEKRLREKRELREQAEKVAGVLPVQTDAEIEESEGLAKLNS